MRTRILLLAVSLCVCGASAPAEPNDEPRPESETRLRRSVEKLGSRSFQIRTEATRQLLDAGQPAAAAIGKWLDRNDPEATARARRVLQKLAETDDVELILTVYRALARIAGDDSTGKPDLAALMERELNSYLKQQLPARRLQAGKIAITSLSVRKCTGRGALFLAYLKNLPNLQRLSLENSNATDASIQYLEPLTGLQSLNLNATRITDEALEGLSALDGLESLYLCDTAVSDAGLAHLKPLSKLRVLWLDRTSITDEGIEHVRELKGLRFLHVTGTSVSRASLESLQQDRPKLRIVP